MVGPRHQTPQGQSVAKKIVNNEFVGHEWGDLPIVFSSDEVTGKNIGKWHHERQKIIILGNECIDLFCAPYCMYWTHDSIKTTTNRSFRHCR